MAAKRYAAVDASLELDPFRRLGGRGRVYSATSTRDGFSDYWHTDLYFMTYFYGPISTIVSGVL